MTLHVAVAAHAGEFRLAIDLDVAAGEVVAVLGPNGAGKSTLLRVIAGLHPIDSGEVRVDGMLLDDANGTWVPPERRRVGVVFADHRLFPHLRAVDNVAFGLRSQGRSRVAARAAAAQWLTRMGLEDLIQRRPRDMSGGQAQRVALARALATEPTVLLLDEPLAALDVQTRAAIQGNLRQHLRRYGGATVLVTHDPVEALLLADRIVVVERGSIVQQGTAAEITTRPRTPYVARLVGVNLYRGVASGGRVRLDGGGELVAAAVPDGPVLAVLRPSAFTVHLEQPQHSSARNVWPATVAALAPLADRVRLEVSGSLHVLVDVTPAAVAELGLAPGTPIWLSAKATDLDVYPADATVAS